MLDKDTLEKYSKQTNFKIGNTSFVIQKLLPMEAMSVLEELRASLNISGSDAIESILLKALVGMPPAVVASVRGKLFAEISFKNKNQQTSCALLGNENTAFLGLEATDIYQVLGRALAVNFFQSFTGIMSDFAVPTQDTLLPNAET